MAYPVETAFDGPFTPVVGDTREARIVEIAHKLFAAGAASWSVEREMLEEIVAVATLMECLRLDDAAIACIIEAKADG